MNNVSLPYLVLGAGGHAKVLIDALRQNQHKIVGVVTPDMNRGDNYLGLKVVGGDETILEYASQDIILINGVGSLPGKQQRWVLSVTMREKGYQFGKVIHPNSIVSSDVMLADGAQLLAGTIIQPGCKVGQDSIINTGAQIDHDSIIGDHCHIAPGVTLSGDVRIGNSVHIGTGAQVTQGIRIDDGSVIAAGTTIYNDVPSGMLVYQQATTVMEALKD